MTERIGKVKLNLQFYSGRDWYSDGEIEDSLLKIVQSNDEYEAVLRSDDRWPVLYHLSQERRNIIDVMQIQEKDSLLEIGAGCGALTGGFAERAGKVVCVDLSKKRSEINATRHQKYDNIEIIVGNFSDIEFVQTFDVIMLIGVLEYADSYMDGDLQAHLHFLEKMYRLLSPGGRIYIAIENKYGLKYFAGGAEDHTGRMFDGIVDYVMTSGVRTFAKSELTELLKKSGFAEQFYYYPMPDYKFASAVFSEKHLPKEGELRELGISYDRPRDVLFSEEQAYNGLIRAGYFDIFANSFLIEAVKGQ